LFNKGGKYHGPPKSGSELKPDGKDNKWPLIVYQTGEMRAVYFEKYKSADKSIINENPQMPAAFGAHLVFGDDYADYSYFSGRFDEYYDDYDYDEYEYDDEYSLYEQAAVNLKKAREQFRVAQQLIKWKGRGNSRLLGGYYD